MPLVFRETSAAPPRAARITSDRICVKRCRKSTPNSSLLFSVSSPITVLNATCGALTSISSRIFCTFTTTSRFPRMMIVFAR